MYMLGKIFKFIVEWANNGNAAVIRPPLSPTTKSHYSEPVVEATLYNIVK